jgi:hypothetical protein
MLATAKLDTPPTTITTTTATTNNGIGSRSTQNQYNTNSLHQTNTDYMLMNNIDQYNGKIGFYPWKKHEPIEQNHSKQPILGPSSSASSSSSTPSYNLNMNPSSTNPHDFLYTSIDTNYQQQQQQQHHSYQHHQFIQKAFQDSSNSLYTNWWDVNNCWLTPNNNMSTTNPYPTNETQVDSNSNNNNENYSYNHSIMSHHQPPNYQNAVQNSIYFQADSTYKPYLPTTTTTADSLNNSNNSDNNNQIESKGKQKSNDLKSGKAAKRSKPSPKSTTKLNENSTPEENNSEPTTAAPTTVSKPRYGGRSQCDCPNCQEADSLGPEMSAQLKKRNIHSCHVAGCGKVYNKTSHLKAHLRWHSG